MYTECFAPFGSYLFVFLKRFLSQELVAAALKLRSALVAIAAPLHSSENAKFIQLGMSGSSMLGVVKLLEVHACI